MSAGNKKHLRLPKPVREGIYYFDSDVLMPGLAKGLERLYGSPDDVIEKRKGARNSNGYWLRYLPQERFDMAYLLTWVAQNVFQMDRGQKRYAVVLLSATGLFSRYTIASVTGVQPGMMWFRKETGYEVPHVLQERNFAPEGKEITAEAAGYTMEALRPERLVEHQALKSAIDHDMCHDTLVRLLAMRWEDILIYASTGKLTEAASRSEMEIYEYAERLRDGTSGVSRKAPPVHHEAPEDSGGLGNSFWDAQEAAGEAGDFYPTCEDFREDPVLSRRKARQWCAQRDLPLLSVRRHVQKCRCPEPDKAVAKECGQTSYRKDLTAEAVRRVFGYP